MKELTFVLCARSNGRGRKRTILLEDVETREVLKEWKDDGQTNWLIREMLFMLENDKKGIRAMPRGGPIPVRNFVNYGIEAPQWVIDYPTNFEMDDLFDENGKLIPYELKDYSHLKD